MELVDGSSGNLLGPAKQKSFEPRREALEPLDVSSRRFWPFFALPLAPILSDISLPFSAFSHVR